MKTTLLSSFSAFGLSRPVGTFKERLLSFFLGASPQLVDPEAALSDANRFLAGTMTETLGTVRVDIHVVVAVDAVTSGVSLCSR